MGQTSKGGRPPKSASLLTVAERELLDDSILAFTASEYFSRAGSSYGKKGDKSSKEDRKLCTEFAQANIRSVFKSLAQKIRDGEFKVPSGTEQEADGVSSHTTPERDQGSSPPLPQDA